MYCMLSFNYQRTYYYFCRVEAPGFASDHAPFIFTAGVPAVQLSYKQNPELGMSSYPLYHTSYDTFFLFDTYIDPEYKV